MIWTPTKMHEKTILEDQEVQRRQRLRLNRFFMAMLTYTVVILATFLITRLGLGMMNEAQWITFIGVALLGNIVFFILFYTNGNLHFSDPSLTREQIAYSAFWGIIPLYSLPEARPIVLMFYLPAFSFGMLRLTRQKYLSVVAIVMGFYTSILVFQYYQDSQGFRTQYELFLFAIFGIFLTWFAFFGGFVSNLRQRLSEQNKTIQKAHIEKDNLIVELKEALSKVKTLSGLLPICASCKKIRDDRGYWNQIESYICDHSEAEFSHSICPECARKLYPELHVEKDAESDLLP